MTLRLAQLLQGSSLDAASVFILNVCNSNAIRKSGPFSRHYTIINGANADSKSTKATIGI